MFKTNAENHDYNTRNALNFEYPNNKLNFCDKSITYQGAKICNNIPSHVKSSKNLNSFKTSFKQLIIADYNIRLFNTQYICNIMESRTRQAFGLFPSPLSPRSFTMFLQ